MGNCMNSTGKATDKEINDVGDIQHIAAQPNSQNQAKAEDLFKPQMKPEEFIDPVTFPNTDLPHLYHSLRCRQAHLVLSRLEAELFDIGGDQDHEESAIETSDDPKKLLTKEAAAVVERSGEFQQGKRVRGVVTHPAKRLPDSSIYIGQWSPSPLCRKGFGRLYNVDGSYIEGLWRDGKPHLRARIVNSNGDCYEGEVQFGVKEGVGKFVSEETRMEYEGEWKGGVQSGKGREKLNDGTVYEGDFLNGNKTGKGKFQWPDGSWYSGDILNGEIEGAGEYSWQDGKKYQGEWKAGKMHGQGQLTFPDGKMYKGSYVMDKKEGRGEYHWDGKVYEGDWLANKMHGFGFLTVPDKGRKQYEFKEGKQVREVKE